MAPRQAEKLFFFSGFPSTVFQAEIYAIQIAVRRIGELTTEKMTVDMFVDSLIVIKTLYFKAVKSRCVLTCIQCLALLGLHRIRIVWFPGHAAFVEMKLPVNVRERLESGRGRGPSEY